jgi:LmbE family N-acetylglucosaminyl deacetylase
MNWIYLSPHLDDIALSCGGLVWEQTQSGEKVSIWTICAGVPQANPLSDLARSLHSRWEIDDEAVKMRRGEDNRANRRLGAISVHFSILDAIYRYSQLDGKPLYPSEADLSGELSAEDFDLAEALREDIRKSLPRDSELVCPLAIGGHVDHQLVKLAAQGVKERIWYYADYPYVVQQTGSQNIYAQGMSGMVFPVSETGLKVWGEAVAEHKSQISTFWSDISEMKLAIQEYWSVEEGVKLWRHS